MIQEKEFYRELANVPELPAGLYDSVDRETGRHRTYLRPLLALAAGLVVAVGTAAFLMTSRPAAVALSPELADELLSVSDYLSGSDLDKELNTYVLYGE